MSRHQTQQTARVQVEIDEQPYRQHMEHPRVAVRLWTSIENECTLVFEEVDPAHQRLEPAGPVLGTLPRPAIRALEDAGYEVIR